MHATRLSLLVPALAVVIGVIAFAGEAPVSRAGTAPAVNEAPSGEVTAEPSVSADPTEAPSPTASPEPTPTASPTPTPTPTPVVPRSDTLRLRRLAVISGSISPKSVVATQTGLVFAQNMMYRHTMTVYNRRGQLVKTISDRVILSRYGFAAYPRAVNGAPVEAAVAPDGKHVYVSQYSMYGPGFGHPGWDTGWVNDVIDRSFVYEVSTATLRITRIIHVGPVPKAVGVSPDGKWLLVGNWTHRDLSLVSLRTGREVKRIVIGGNPRGIAFAPNSSVVYLTAESGQKLLEYSFSTGRLRTLISLLPGEPRHLVIDPTGHYLYASLNKGGQVVKIDIGLRRVVDRVTTGTNPRTIALAPDGRSLYVVNYESRTVAKVRTKDMLVIQRLTTAGVHPVGLTYEIATRTVWVSCYRGTIERFADR
jgi:DNA-binding beta-propeller fold protein YncE